MKILANENFPKAVIDAMRGAGHDVVWVREDSPGISDTAVVERGIRESRLIATFDKDFGEMAFKSGMNISCGVVLFRIPMRSPEFVAAKVVEVLSCNVEWTNRFAVVTEDRIRTRSMPR